jgi:hypothetical protein
VVGGLVKFSRGVLDDLTLYVRQSAWLNTAPERPNGDKSGEPVPSRVEKMRKDRGDDTFSPEMPPLEVGGYLATYLFEVGPAGSGAMGPTVITHQEIQSWQTLTGIVLQPWEVRALRRLSGEYIAESRKAEKRDRLAPWQPGAIAPEDLSAVADAMRKSMQRRAAL